MCVNGADLVRYLVASPHSMKSMYPFNYLINGYVTIKFGKFLLKAIQGKNILSIFI